MEEEYTVSRLIEIIDKMEVGDKAELSQYLDRYFIELDVRSTLDDSDVEYDNYDVDTIVDEVYENYNYGELIDIVIDNHFVDEEEDDEEE